MYSSYRPSSSRKAHVHENYQSGNRIIPAVSVIAGGAMNILSSLRSMSNKKLIATSILLVAMIQFKFQSFPSRSGSRSRSLSIQRMLSDRFDTTPYLTTTDTNARSPEDIKKLVSSMDSPRIPGRRSPPSHIILCSEFLRRKQMHQDNEVIQNDFHVVEDDAVCRDWSTPHLSLMEMASNNIISHVASKYRVSYAHNCGKDNSPDKTEDGLEWTTIQEAFPPSGLVLDNGVVDEEQIADLCHGCIGSYNQKLQDHEDKGDVDPDNPNPSWFNPHHTHHCILYPGTERPLVNDQMEMDMVALTEHRARAQEAPFAKVLDTIKDRLRLAAVEFKLEHGDPPITLDGGSGSGSGRFADSVSSSWTSGAGTVRKLFQSVIRNRDPERERRDRILAEEAEAVPYGTNIEEKNGAVIYLDDGSYPISQTSYAKNIPTTVSTIDILISPLCVDVYLLSGEKCSEHADDLQKYMTTMYPDSIVSQDVVTSTHAAYSRMILAKYLVCPPGTSVCLMPSLAKEVDTFAVMAESPARQSTFGYFDFVNTHEDHLQVAHVPNGAEAAIPNGAEAISLGSVPESFKRTFIADGKVPVPVLDKEDDAGAEAEGEAEQQPNDSAPTDADGTAIPESSARFAGLDMENFMNQHDYRDGCIELRGKLGSWELDYSYEDLKIDEASSLLRGQSNVDVAEARFQGPNEGVELSEQDTVEGQFGAWNEDVNPNCALDMLNLNGLCQVVASMGLGVLQFVGDQYMEEQVRSFWALLGLDDRDDPLDLGEQPLEDGQDLPQYRKTAHCPNENMAFDIVFTPNEYLVHTEHVEVPVYINNTPETRYVPVPSPTTPQQITNNYFYDNSQTSHDYSTATTSNTEENRYSDTSNSYTDRNSYESRTSENFSRTSGTDNANWYNQPYGNNGGYGGYSGYGGYGGYGGWGYGGGMAMGMGAPMMPMYSAACCCVPFQQQYQHYGGGGGYGGGGYGGGGSPNNNNNGGLTESNPFIANQNNLQDMTNQAKQNNNNNNNYNEVAAAGRQIVVAGMTPNTSFDTFVDGIDEFGRGITDYVKNDDVVILRTGVDGMLPDPSRRRQRRRRRHRRMNSNNEAGPFPIDDNDSDFDNDTDPSQFMTHEELIQANKHILKSVDEYRRRTKQMDLVGSDPSKSGLPSIHVLDITRMTATHPHSTDIHHGRRNEQVAPLYDHWNHLLYSNLRDLAVAEVRRKTRLDIWTLLESAPEGSPYHNGVQSFPDPL